MELIYKLQNEIQFNAIKYMSHPVSDLMKQRINSYNKSNVIFNNFL